MGWSQVVELPLMIWGAAWPAGWGCACHECIGMRPQTPNLTGAEFGVMRLMFSNTCIISFFISINMALD